MNDTPSKVGRKPLEPGQRRDTTLRVKVRASAATAFDAEAKRRNLTRSEAIRQALTAWMSKTP